MYNLIFLKPQVMKQSFPLYMFLNNKADKINVVPRGFGGPRSPLGNKVDMYPNTMGRLEMYLYTLDKWHMCIVNMYVVINN